jgi:hypothetical protein
VSTCIICHFEAEEDDKAVENTNGHYICVRCFNRETGGVKPMPQDLRRDVIAALNSIEV